MADIFTSGFYRQLQQLKIHTRRAFLGSRQGGHVTNRKGHGLEFADFRLYSPGDDYRHIDWGVYGRTDRLYIKEFREEQDLNVSFILDGSRSMAYPETSRKFELAKELALALGYVALSDGDTVSFSVLGVMDTPRYSTPRALQKAILAMAKVHPAASTKESTPSFLSEIRRVASKLRIPGRCFLISDFLFDLDEQFRALDVLRAKNFEITVFQVLAPEELTLGLRAEDSFVVDAESGEVVELGLGGGASTEYARALAKHVEALENYCRKAGIQHVLISSAEDVPALVLSKLPQLGLLR